MAASISAHEASRDSDASIQRDAVALIATAALGIATHAAVASTWPIRPYYDFVHFVSIGNFDRAFESFADDATVVIDEVCPGPADAMKRRTIDLHTVARHQD